MAATYTYKFRDKSGQVQEGELEGASRAAVAKALRDRGYNPISVDEKKDSAFQKEIKIPGFSDRIKVKDVSVFSRQFATMINSGLSLLRSLNILAEQTQNSAFAKIILEVKAEVEKGATLSDAMAKYPKAFSTLYVAMVKAGEIGGVLDETLIRLADTIEAQVELRSKIRSAMMYPTAVMGLVLLIVTAMLIFIVPMFESLYADLGGIVTGSDQDSAHPVTVHHQVLVSGRARVDWHRHSFQEMDREHEWESAVRRDQAQASRVRRVDPQDGARPFLPHSGRTHQDRCPDTPGDGHRRCHVWQCRRRQGGHGRPGLDQGGRVPFGTAARPSGLPPYGRSDDGGRGRNWCPRHHAREGRRLLRQRSCDACRWSDESD